jgi:TIR domain-containing protein
MAKETIFISYRRQDTAAYAGRIYDRLSAKYGENNVFMDIDRIEPGQDFVEVINHSVAEAGVLLVLIGREWIKMTDKSGVSRLNNPEDFVRLEILAGLEQKTVIIPVLLADAEMPPAQALPPPLQPFTRRNAIEISDSRFHSDVDRLIEAIDKIFEPQGTTSSPNRPEHRNRGATAPNNVSAIPNTGYIAAAIAALVMIVGGIWWFTARGERDADVQAEPYNQSRPTPKSVEDSPRQDPRQSPMPDPRQSPVQQYPNERSPGYSPKQSAPRE